MSSPQAKIVDDVGFNGETNSRSLISLKERAIKMYGFILSSGPERHQQARQLLELTQAQRAHVEEQMRACEQARLKLHEDFTQGTQLFESQRLQLTVRLETQPGWAEKRIEEVAQEKQSNRRVYDAAMQKEKNRLDDLLARLRQLKSDEEALGRQLE